MKTNKLLKNLELINCPHCGNRPYAETWRMFTLAYGKIICPYCNSSVIKFSLTSAKALYEASKIWNKRYDLNDSLEFISDKSKTIAIKFNNILFIREDLTINHDKTKN